MKKNTRFKRGFTFLEVMIAIAIFGIVGIVCIQTYLMVIKQVKSVSDMEKVIIVANSKIEELKTEEEIEEKSGIFPEPFENYEWELKLSNKTIQDTEIGIVFTPFTLEIKWNGNSYSVISPFVKSEKEK
ncbi:type II secretion system protein [bacterium]|nr:type II secretion system protein [bacterium]